MSFVGSTTKQQRCREHFTRGGLTICKGFFSSAPFCKCLLLDLLQGHSRLRRYYCYQLQLLAFGACRVWLGSLCYLTSMRNFWERLSRDLDCSVINVQWCSPLSHCVSWSQGAGDYPKLVFGDSNARGVGVGSTLKLIKLNLQAP